MQPRRIPIEPAGNPDVVDLDEAERPYLDAVANALAAWTDFHLARANDDAGTGVQAVRRISTLAGDLVTAEQRRVLLFALGDGMSLADVGAQLDLSRWAVAKRWPDLIEQARPLRWLSTNHTTWHDALSDLLAQEESHAQQLSEQQRQALEQLRQAVDAHAAHGTRWWLLIDTPQLARTLVRYQPPRKSVERHVAHDWIHALLADFDRTNAGDKPHARVEVTQAAVRAATLQRLGQNR